MPASSTPWFPGVPAALGAAFLFGLSTPAVKPLLGAVDPWLAAGLLYAGAGVGLALVQLTRSAARLSPPEAPLRRADLPWLAGIVVTGGVLAPLLLMFGLARSDAASASLLLNLEGVATLAIAWLVAREHVDRKLLLGALSIIAGAVLLSWRGGAEINIGAVFIALACAAWGIDNNLTRRLSSADPIQIAMIKGLFAGAANLVLSLAAGSPCPIPPPSSPPPSSASSDTASAWFSSSRRCATSGRRAPALISPSPRWSGPQAGSSSSGKSLAGRCSRPER